MKLSEIIADYLAAAPAGVVIDQSAATKYLKQALRQYCGYATLANLPPQASTFRTQLDAVFIALDAPLFYDGVWQSPASLQPWDQYSRTVVDQLDALPGDAPAQFEATIDGQSVLVTDIELTLSELALIRPLFLLYCERENATHLEASRALGVDVYGRSVAEVTTDIKEYEENLPHRSFVEPAIMVV